jgi:7,8-dihydropterin-6-yl-methyl-4-(beta-D-ribofuranosyl)aminobenzene 5'-phosphate synthase
MKLWYVDNRKNLGKPREGVIMKLTVLMDNTTILDTPYLSESGLSFLIETDDAKIVFDTGYSPIFLSNAKKMGIDLTDITGVVISHGHNDHTNGLPALGKLLNRKGLRVPIILHPVCMEKKWWANKDGSLEAIGMPICQDTLKLYYNVMPTTEVTKIGESLYYLGTIPRYNPSANEPIGLVANTEGLMEPDYVIDDSAIVYNGENGLVIINGCAHSGLVNILEYAQRIFPGRPLLAIIGGFHMLSKSQAWMEATASQISAFNPKSIYPCHCTDEASRAYLRNQFQVGTIGVGTALTFE